MLKLFEEVLQETTYCTFCVLCVHRNYHMIMLLLTEGVLYVKHADNYGSVILLVPIAQSTADCCIIVLK